MMSRGLSIILRPKLNNYLQIRSIFKCKVVECPKPKPPLNVTIIGVNSNVGKFSALLLKNNKIFKNIILYDWEDITEVFNDLQYVTTSSKLIGYSGWRNLQDAIQVQTESFIPIDLYTGFVLLYCNRIIVKLYVVQIN